MSRSTLTGICVSGEPEKATFAEGGLMPSIVISFVTSDCRKSGRLFYRFCDRKKNQLLALRDFVGGLLDLTLRKPIRHGCGLAFSNRSNRSQNSSGSTLASTSSWISVRTFFSTGFGSRLDSSIRLVRNFLHFSLVLSNELRCWAVWPPVVVVTTTVCVACWPCCWGCCGCWVVTTFCCWWVDTTVGWPVAMAVAGDWAADAEMVMCCWAASAGTGATEATGVDCVVT